MKEILSPLGQWVPSPHLSDGYATDYFGHSNSRCPQEARQQQGPLFPPSTPLSRLVFLWLSYSEGLGPPPKQSRPCTKDHLGDFSHKLLTTQLTTQSIFYLSVGGWEFMVKALNAQLALVTMEPYPQNSLRLRHAILLSAAEMRRSFWLSLLWSAQVALWKEGDGERKGGVRVQTKGSHWDSLSVIKFVETQKELQSHSREHLERDRGVIGQHSSCQSASFSTQRQTN